MQFDSTLPTEGRRRTFPIPVFSKTVGSWRLSVDRSPFAADELAAHYDRKSHAWHRIVRRHGFADAYQSLIARVLCQPRYRQDAETLRVLDAGVGTGAMTSAFRAALGRRFRLDGVDISAAMLHEAHQHLAQEDINVALKQANLERLPFPDNSFEVVLAAHVIEHLPQPQRALGEIYRVLKPGGILICSVTRSSPVGAYIQLIWRTHRVPVPTACHWLRRSGLRSVRAFPFAKQTAARRFSLGYVGRKPL